MNKPWLYRRVIDRIVAFWLIFPIALLEKVFRVKFFVKGDGFNYMDRTLTRVRQLDTAILGSALQFIVYEPFI